MATGRPALHRAGRFVACAAALGVAGVFVAHGVELARYPWDWDPGEALSVDYARRLMAAPATLYPRESLTPVPLLFTPLLYVLLAPLVSLGQTPFAGGRTLTLAASLAAAAAVYALVRRRGDRPLAVVAAALALAPVSHTFWLTLVRVDALMIALWLWAAVLVLPDRLGRGASPPLSWRRAAGGAAMLVASVMAKPTAVIYGAPLVLGWLLVDRRSALRLGGLTMAIGVGVFAVMQALTGGGFVRSLALQLLFNPVEGQAVDIVFDTIRRQAFPTALALGGLLAALRRRDDSWRDGALLLWLAGPLSYPLLSKSGALPSYLLPWAFAQAALAGRWLAAAYPGASPGKEPRAFGHLLGAVVAAVCLVQQRFPLPTAADRATADAFYAFVASRGRPILSTGPEMAYVHVGEPVEVEGPSLFHFAERRPEAIRPVLDVYERGAYRLIVERPRWFQFTSPAYRAVAACELGYFHGRTAVRLLVPAAEAANVRPPSGPGVRCRAGG